MLNLIHLPRFDCEPICRICGAPFTRDDYLNDTPCPGPIDLHQVVADMSGDVYLGREKRDALVWMLRNVIRRLE